MSGQGRTRSREAEEYGQLDSNIIPQPQGVEEGIDSGLGQATTSAGAVAIPHRPSTSGSDQGVEESQGAVATGGKKKSRGLKHAFQMKIMNRIVKPRTSSSGDSQLSPDRVEADPQNILEGESSMEDPAELEERLREEMEEKLRAELREEMEEKVRAELREGMEEKVRAELREEMEEKVRAELREEKVRAELREEMEEKLRAELREKMEEKLRVELREEMKEEKANWTKTAEAKWKDEAKGELQKLREDLAGKFEEERNSTAKQAQSELENVKQKNTAILRLKARELQDKETAIKSLQEEVGKLKRSEGSFADLTEKNLELKKGIRHKEEMERLQLEKIQDLKKLLEEQNVSQQKEQTDQQANRHKTELDIKDRHHQDNLQQAEERLKLIQQFKENVEVQLTKKVEELTKVMGQLEDAEKLRGELEKECRDLQIQNDELLMKTKRNEVEEQGQAENEGDTKHENEMRSLQYELELAQNELKQERERGRAKLRELEDKLRAVEEGAVQTGRVTLLEPSGALGAKGSTIAQYNGQEQMKPDDSAQPPLAGVQWLKTDSELAGVNKFLTEEVSSVRKQLKTLECEREDAEKDAERKITAERDSNQELESEVARLKLALKFWESKYPQDDKDPVTTGEEIAEKLRQIEVIDLQRKIERRDSAIQNLTDCRCTLESRMARLREERDRYAEQNSELLAMKGELNQCRVLNEGLKGQLKVKVAEAEALKTEKEVMVKEAEDLLCEIEARKVEVHLVRQDFEEEHKERENLASRVSDEFGKWQVREQKLMEQLQYGESRLRVVGVNHQEGMKQMDNKLKCLTHESEQRELQLIAKLEQTGKLQQELDAQCDHLRVELDGVRMEWKEEFELRQKQEKEHQEIVEALEQQMDEESDRLKEERDVMKAEWNKVADMYEEQKRKHQAELKTLQGEYQHQLSHAEGQLESMEEQLQHLRGEQQHVEEHLVSQKLKQEKFLGSMKHEFEIKLHEIGYEKDALASKLGALEQLRKHDYAQSMADRRELEEAVADAARLSDEVMALEQQLKHHKAQADSFKAKLQEKMRHFEQLSKEREEEHREEVEIIRAQCENEKMDQERLMIPLKRELDQLRSQASDKQEAVRRAKDDEAMVWKGTVDDLQKLVNNLEDELHKDELSQYLLTNVEPVRDSTFSDSGCYGSVSLVEVNGGAKCISKRIQDILVGYGIHENVGEVQKRSMEDKFRDECIYLSRMRHPNIVQFVGVHSKNSRLSLIMEFLPMSMRKCIDRCNSEHFTIPTSSKVSILKDVIYGLVHLHSLSIAHRDLSAQNILLTSDLRAKIADLGVSKLLTPLQQSRLTKSPGAPDIMPPETRKENCQYTCQIDIFSFGVLSLYLILQEYPNVSDEGLIPDHLRNKEIEVGRRIRHIHEVPRFCHGSVPIIRGCLQDLPEKRPHAFQLKRDFEYLCKHYPRKYNDAIEMLQAVHRLEQEHVRSPYQGYQDYQYHPSRD